MGYNPRKIKHWAGYGYVTVQKEYDKKVKGEPYSTGRFTFQYDYHRKLRIRVKGRHERGLVPDGKYELFRWLIMKFDRNVTLDNVHRVSMMSRYSVTPMSYDGDEYLIDVDYAV